MDSKELFRLYNKKYDQANWLDDKGALAQNEKDVKCYYCGVGNDLKRDFISRFIDEFFADDEVYLCIASNRSSLVLKSIVIDEIVNYLGEKEIGIINKSVT